MSDGAAGGGIFPNPPTENEIRVFVDFYRRTGEPEKYEKLDHQPPHVDL